MQVQIATLREERPSRLRDRAGASTAMSGPPHRPPADTPRPVIRDAARVQESEELSKPGDWSEAICEG